MLRRSMAVSLLAALTLLGCDTRPRPPLNAAGQRALGECEMRAQRSPAVAALSTQRATNGMAWVQYENAKSECVSSCLRAKGF
jgi:hypothetical protein